MSQNHLAKGSQEPPKVDGLLRLYSMEFCPYAQRTRLVLKVKNIPHDIVNINLSEKPEWYFKIHPEGKVPALYTGSKVIVESLDISDYLDDTYPEPALYPKDAAAKQKDKEVVAKISELTAIWGQSLFNKEKQPAEHWAKAYQPVLDYFENELAQRGSQFFGGNQPGMVDLMLWPFAERSSVLTYIQGKELFPKESYPKLRSWCKALASQPAVKETAHKPEVHWKLTQAKLNGTPLNVDQLNE